MDGNSATGYGDNSCTHTATGQNKPWWRVDLGKVEHVTEVYIVNREISVGNRLSEFEIRVGMSPFATSLVTLTYMCTHTLKKGQIVGLGFENVKAK